MSLFYRLDTDGCQRVVDLGDFYLGPGTAACWIVGGGPSLNEEVAAILRASPAPKFAMNLCGAGLVRPTLWTSYDPSVRFHRSIYLDASIQKFVHRRRAMDVVPETTIKVCECPNLVFFDRHGCSSYGDWLDAGKARIGDWADSFLQAIELAYRLGFRQLLLAGCDMRIESSDRLRELAKERSLATTGRESLSELVALCEKGGVDRKTLARSGSGQQYHFDEQKEFWAAVRTDSHYFRVAQYLRLSRQSLARAGLQLVSVTPGSRLNDYVDYEPIAMAAERVLRRVGDPRTESTRGLYRGDVARQPLDRQPMRDLRPPRAGLSSPDAATRPVEILVEQAGWERGVGR
ncbi:MAG: hypothetical protein KF777_12485 [Planctomycetaceae bacterium]|nr:hypothetical protein [Planctomycetaceae bacterium]